MQDIGGSDLDGRIMQMNGKLPPEEEIALYEMAHCYLQPSRGEGFGLQPLQAIAQGIPTILTDAHGHASFSHLGWGIGSKPVKAAYFIYGDAGEWWEPDLDDLCDRMRWMYDNWTEATITAAYASDVVAEQFTWKHTAEKFIGMFDDLAPGSVFRAVDRHVPHPRHPQDPMRHRRHPLRAGARLYLRTTGRREASVGRGRASG